MYMMLQFKWIWNYINFNLYFFILKYTSNVLFFWEVHVHTVYIDFCKGSNHQIKQKFDKFWNKKHQSFDFKPFTLFYNQ